MLILFTVLLDRFELTVISSVGATNRRGVGASLTWWGRDPGKDIIWIVMQKGPIDSNFKKEEVLIASRDKTCHGEEVAAGSHWGSCGKSGHCLTNWKIS